MYVSVCVSSYHAKTATCLIYTLKVRCQTFCADFSVCIVWILSKMLCSKVLTFADHLCLLHFLTSSQWTKETDMASFQEDRD